MRFHLGFLTALASVAAVSLFFLYTFLVECRKSPVQHATQSSLSVNQILSASESNIVHRDVAYTRAMQSSVLETNIYPFESNFADHDSTLTYSLLQHSLYNCSRNMGLSRNAIMNSTTAFKEITRKVTTFLDEISTLLPHQLSPQLRNPCWKTKKPKLNQNILTLSYNLKEKIRDYNFPKRYFDEETLIFCLPFFFLAGFPKSGTTTVHKMLSVHPDIVPPSLKEPHGWTRGISKRLDGDFQSENIISNFLLYTQSFQPLVSKMAKFQHESLITYDASQSTMWDSNFDMDGQDFCATPAVLSYVLPSAKFIVVMRNPATRLYSNFIYSCTNKYSGDLKLWPNKVRENTAKNFHNRIEKLIEQFNNCTEKLSLFECVNLRTKREEDDSGCKLRRQRLTIGMYVVHIKKWLQFFPLENFLFIRTEDLSKNPEDVVRNLTNFLGIQRASEVMSKILKQQKNAHPSGVQPMDFRTLELLNSFYHPFNRELSQLLNNQLFLWND